jgi:hypothetical protein
MGCGLCKNEPRITYFRWKNANIEIHGCEIHLREIIQVLRDAQQKNFEKALFESGYDSQGKKIEPSR